MTPIKYLFLIAFTASTASVSAQSDDQISRPSSDLPAYTSGNWLQCTALPNSERLACFDRWASAPKVDLQNLESNQQLKHTDSAFQAIKTEAISASASPDAPALPTLAADDDIDTTRAEGCKDRRYSALSRFWELERGTDCNTFGIRGYRPISLSVVGADSVNHAPNSPSAGHTASDVAYQRMETRIQLSVRTKIAQGLLTSNQSTRHDSLWFGYTQQSYWQLFNGAISRPFRTTDHEPEVIYVYPSTADLPGGWRLRYSGLGLVHQSNGQSLPLSRSWNRVYLMAGMEHGNHLRITARAWQRLPEKTNDDNPDIVNRIGRGEIQALWDADTRNTYAATARNSLRTQASGSLRLEWLRTLGNPQTSGLRLHTQLFSGYGDSLVDYNRRRVMLSVGLSLVDF